MINLNLHKYELFPHLYNNGYKKFYRCPGFIFLFLVLCLSSIYCKKNNTEAQLPPITQDGKNTFGCKVDGLIWLPYWPCHSLVAGAYQLDYAIYSYFNTSAYPL